MIDDVKRWDLFHQKTYKERVSHSKYAEDREKFFPRGSIVVDMGGGTGSDTLYFLRKGHSVVLLDISGFALKKARERAEKEGLEKSLVTKQVDFGLHNLPIKPDSVDIVYSRVALNYFGSHHTTKLFRDIYEILKPGGKAFLALESPENKDEMEYLEKMASVYEPNVFIENGQLISRFTQDQLREMLIVAQIPEFKLNRYKEDMSYRPETNRKWLILNEVVIEKS